MQQSTKPYVTSGARQGGAKPLREPLKSGLVRVGYLWTDLWTADGRRKPYIGFRRALNGIYRRRGLILRRKGYLQTYKKAAANLHQDYRRNAEYTHFTNFGDPY